MKTKQSKIKLIMTGEKIGTTYCLQRIILDLKKKKWPTKCLEKNQTVVY